jgi:hypothetical protein
MTWLEMVHAEAAKVGRTVTDEQANAILWNHTGFPSFFLGDSAVDYFTNQVREFFAGKRHCCACGDSVDVDGIGGDCLLCAPCKEDIENGHAT